MMFPENQGILVNNELMLCIWFFLCLLHKIYWKFSPGFGQFIHILLGNINNSKYFCTLW